MSRTPHTFTASYILLIKDGQVLLSRRFQTGFEDGKYSVPAGHVEPNETFTQALIREVEEETGITLIEDRLKVSHIMHRKTPEREYVDVYFSANEWKGTLENKEPEKCDHLSWFPLNDLPKNIIPYLRQAIECSIRGVFYSESGF
ncbi:MAG: NUDIX domain-containing protein [Candidatus Moranbacteria bacterium]|nr:NUDIX domain-containing protein [Candidatus Moranbacteria bacterium]MDD3965125.1 NUDIX domain-containing protein [Candidatus Moranbacteria bacterium]